MSSRDPIVVVGGGHAGVEAAAAAARMGAEVILVTLKADALVRLSCNPAIGGIGKSHLVREIDAMGGLMGLAADLAGVHFRVLNRRRGPAVQGARVQQDLERYPEQIRRLLPQQGHVEVVEAEASGLVVRRGRVVALRCADGRELPASALVLTTGTFLRGRLFRGEVETPGGRVGEAPCEGLSASLAELGLRLGRFKTGTPPRLLAESIDFGALEEQPGDAAPEPLSFSHFRESPFEPTLPQLLTWIAHSNARTHEVVREGLDRSPLYTGRIDALGPRYCPSFEDKVVKFPDKASHLFHLEPMGLEHPWIYVNGLSTSLPEELQRELVHSIRGLERAEIARFGYAVAYDFVWPTQLSGILETKALSGLFLAGQICGTTGYEEAAGLGLVAGVNAVLSSRGDAPWRPDRLACYLGVMVDDLTTRGVLEPYRMFTSRSEVRLSLSPDSADRRLGPLAERLGLLSAPAVERARRRWESIERAQRAIDPPEGSRRSMASALGERVRRGESLEALLSELPDEWARLGHYDARSLENLLRYAGYLEREARELERLQKAENTPIAPDLDYTSIPGLRPELVERLAETRPRSLGQASRIPGVTPAALALLLAHSAGDAREAG